MCSEAPLGSRDEKEKSFIVSLSNMRVTTLVILALCVLFAVSVHGSSPREVVPLYPRHPHGSGKYVYKRHAHRHRDISKKRLTKRQTSESSLENHMSFIKDQQGGGYGGNEAGKKLANSRTKRGKRYN